MSRPQFILVAGPNGAGKTTFTHNMKRHLPNIEIVDPDAIAKAITGSFSTVDQEQLGAGKKAISMVRRYVENRQPFLVESTISGSTYLKYAKQAKENGFRTVFIYIALKSAELSAQRVSSRVDLGGHDIPLNDIQRRYPKSMNNIKAHIGEFENAYIYDNSDEYSWVAAYRSGTLHKVSKSMPGWLNKYLP